MKIGVGTENKAKLEAVRQALTNYSDYSKADIFGCSVASGVSSQPIGLDEIISGAKNRAKLAYENIKADLGIGLESGIFLVPHTKSNYMDTTACTLYDGCKYHLGLSSCFEYPHTLIEKIINENKEVSEAALELGFAQNQEFREGLGMVGILTKGVISRKEYSAQAVHMAFIHLLNKDY